MTFDTPMHVLDSVATISTFNVFYVNQILALLTYEQTQSYHS